MSDLVQNLSLPQILLIVLAGVLLANFYLRRANEQLKARLLKLQHDHEIAPLQKEKDEAQQRLDKIQEEFDADLKNYRAKYPVDSGPDGD